MYVYGPLAPRDFHFGDNNYRRYLTPEGERWFDQWAADGPSRGDDALRDGDGPTVVYDPQHDSVVMIAKFDNNGNTYVISDHPVLLTFACASDEAFEVADFYPVRMFRQGWYEWPRSIGG